MFFNMLGIMTGPMKNIGGLFWRLWESCFGVKKLLVGTRR